MNLTRTALDRRDGVEVHAFLSALAAPGPSPALGDAAKDQDWLVGSWDAEVIDYREGAPPIEQHGVWHFAWILEGRALGDVWIVPPPGERTPGEPPGPANRYGLSVRSYDPENGVWRLTWINPVTGVESRLTGGPQGDAIVYLGQEADGTPIRWSFTEIRPTSFVWRGEASHDGGETWALEAEFRARRRATSDVIEPGFDARLPRPGAGWTARWSWADRPGLEALTVKEEEGSVVADSEVLVVLDGVPIRVTYHLVYDRDWQFRRASLDVRTGAQGEEEAERRLEIVRRADGGSSASEERGVWTVNGEARPDLAGCTDLDLMVTPFTNTPPLWRIDHRISRQLPESVVDPSRTARTSRTGSPRGPGMPAAPRTGAAGRAPRAGGRPSVRRTGCRRTRP